MGTKKRKGPKPLTAKQKRQGVIRSDPERVRRAEAEAAWHEYMYGPPRGPTSSLAGIYSRNNAAHPYNGGLPGLGKRR